MRDLVLCCFGDLFHLKSWNRGDEYAAEMATIGSFAGIFHRSWDLAQLAHVI